MAESKLQRKIISDLRKSGWDVVKIILCNKPGQPDVQAGKNKRMIFIECKDEDKDAEPLQKYRHKQLISKGFDVFVVDTWEMYLQIKFQNL